ncbi:MAG: glucose-6-phosphate isomerase family protein [Planctomycetota bacterium]
MNPLPPVAPVTVPQLGMLSGLIDGDGIAAGGRTLGQLTGLFRDEAARAAMPADTPVYRTFATPTPADAPVGELLYSTTIIEPGKVGDEYFMTRGHFHAGRNRGEFCLTLAGEGMLVLMTDDRTPRVEVMRPGSLHLIDGAHAHRTVNTGREPLRFFVVWPADTGHDYESIAQHGFCVRVREVNGAPACVPDDHA